MTGYEIISIILAMISLILSIVSIIGSSKASEKATILSKDIFKRGSIIELYNAWQPVNEIDKNKPVTLDVIKASNALSLTASLWNHDAFEKTILFQSYWPVFRTLYDQINQIDFVLPSYNKTGKSLLTPDITKVYKEMEKYELDGVKQTKM